MLDNDCNIFQCIDWLGSHEESDPQYGYYLEIFKKRKELFETIGNPFFEEIKNKTTGVQMILFDLGYENIDGLLKALIIGGIEFFLKQDHKIDFDDNNLYDDYYLGLFSSLKINVNNKSLLEEIRDELLKGGEEIPESPIDFLANYFPNQRNKHNESEAEILLNRIIQDFHGKYESGDDVKKIGKKEVEDEFLKWLDVNIVKVINGDISTIDCKLKDMFDHYNIDTNNKEFILLLYYEIKNRLSKSNPPVIGNEYYTPI